MLNFVGEYNTDTATAHNRRTFVHMSVNTANAPTQMNNVFAQQIGARGTNETTNTWETPLVNGGKTMIERDCVSKLVINVGVASANHVPIPTKMLLKQPGPANEHEPHDAHCHGVNTCYGNRSPIARRVHPPCKIPKTNITPGTPTTACFSPTSSGARCQPRRFENAI